MTYDIFPCPQRVVAKPSGLHHAQTRWLPDQWGMRLLDFWRVGQEAEIRRTAFVVQPDWLLWFRTGVVAEAERLWDETYATVTRRAAHQPKVDFHRLTGRIASEMWWLAHSHKRAFRRVFTHYRRYMKGRADFLPEIPETSQALVDYAVGPYGLTLTLIQMKKAAYPSQDYSLLYRVPLDLVVKTFRDGTLQEAVDLVDYYRDI